MAATPYYQFVATSNEPKVPEWRNTWPAIPNCTGSRLLILTESTIPAGPSPGTVKSYNPHRLVSSLSSPRESGINIGPNKPPYRPTNYARGTRVYKEHLVTRHCLAYNGLNCWYQYGVITGYPNCVYQETSRASTGPLYNTYDEQLRDFSAYSVYVQSDIMDGQVAALSNDLRNELIAEASTAYDVLTDISQLKDIPRSLFQIGGDLLKIYSAFRKAFGINALRYAYKIRPKDLLKSTNKLLRSLGNEWMNYRYGIMPLVYSMRDISKLLDRGTLVRTRKHKSVAPYQTGQSLPSPSNTYRLKTVEGSVDLFGQVIQFFTSEEEARLSGAGFNPLVTAWELIPYSFVFDWFIDVGSLIAAASNQNWAQTKYAYLSRRSKYTRSEWVHLPEYVSTCHVVNKTPTNWFGAAPPATPDVSKITPAGLHLLNEEVVDEYVRTVIPLTSVLPTFNPSLNWRRLLDGSVMLFNQLGRLMRS